jgi:hypothetical protein
MRTVGRLRDSLSTALERFERTPFGEVLISTLVSMILLIAVVWSSPDSAIRRAAIPALEPMAIAGGLDQAWYMFAPDPFRQLQTVEVHVTTSSGDQRVWTFPHGNVFGQVSWYRWHKLKEQSVQNPDVRADLARWAARQVVDPSEYPARVTLILTTESFPPPGARDPQVETGTETLYTETLPAPR